MDVVLSAVVGIKESPLLRREIWSFVKIISVRFKTFLGKVSGHTGNARSICGRNREEKVCSTLKKETDW